MRSSATDHDSSADAGSRSTSSTATSICDRRCSRRVKDLDRNLTSWSGSGTLPATAISIVTATCVVRPSRWAAATPAGPEPRPATAMAASRSDGAVIPKRVVFPRQHRPRRTRTNSSAAVRRLRADSPARSVSAKSFRRRKVSGAAVTTWWRTAPATVSASSVDNLGLPWLTVLRHPAPASGCGLARVVPSARPDVLDAADGAWITARRFRIFACRGQIPTLEPGERLRKCVSLCHEARLARAVGLDCCRSFFFGVLYVRCR